MRKLIEPGKKISGSGELIATIFFLKECHWIAGVIIIMLAGEVSYVYIKLSELSFFLLQLLFSEKIGYTSEKLFVYFCLMRGCEY